MISALSVNIFLAIRFPALGKYPIALRYNTVVPNAIFRIPTKPDGDPRRLVLPLLQLKKVREAALTTLDEAPAGLPV
jgi:hypothetical protein